MNRIGIEQVERLPEMMEAVAPGPGMTITRAVFGTRDAWAPTLLRVALGVVMFPHGAQKLLGWFGGYGFAGTMEYLTGTVGLPWLVAALVIVIEFFGSLALIVGLGARVAALGVVAVMIGAVVTTHLQVGFFMNWGGNQAGEGYEYHILAIGIGVAVALMGAGAASVDGLIAPQSAEPFECPDGAVSAARGSSQARFGSL